MAANGVAKWDCEKWSPLGEGGNGIAGGEIYALTFNPSGYLYAGGVFPTAGGVAANGVAKWDGEKWSPLGEGVDDEVYALACDASGNLYAGGGFTTAGGVAANGVAKWDGERWSPLGEGIDDYVSALACDASGNLYAGGYFTTAGGVDANGVAKWDGEKWSPLGEGIDGSVSALAIDASGNLYAGGYFTTAGGVDANGVAKWDGEKWSPLGEGVNGSVSALALDASGNLYAGGYFTTAGGVDANGVAKWDGEKWSPLGEGIDDSVSALACDASGNLYAGGWFTTAGRVAANHVARWDGMNWTPLGEGVNGEVYSLAFDSVSSLFVGGWGIDSAGGKLSVNIARCEFPAPAGYHVVKFTANAGGRLNGKISQLALAGGTASAVGATSDTGRHFVNWTGSVTSSDNPLTLGNITADMAVSANFDLNTYTLLYATSAGGNLEGQTTQTVKYGYSGTPVKAVPSTGYHFVAWSDDSTANPRTDSDVSADIAVVANFAINTYILTYAAGTKGALTGETHQAVTHGGSGTAVTAIPQEHYHFVSWSDGSTANPRTDSNVIASLSVTASFAIDTFTLTYFAGEGGKLSGEALQIVNYGSSGVAVAAIAVEHYHFMSWSDGSIVNPRTDVDVNEDITVTASFELDTYVLVYSAGSHGTLAGQASQAVTYGGTGTAITAIPDEGYRFVNWSDGLTANPRTDANVTGNVHVAANFALIVYHQVTFTATAGGYVEGQLSQKVEHGKSCSPVTAIREIGYEFAGWGNGAMDNPLTVADVTSDMTVTAEFTEKAQPEYWVANGSVFTVNASDLDDTSFEKTPKVVSSGGGKAKVMGFKKGSDSVSCVWQGKDKPGTYALLVNGETLTEEFVVENPNDFDVTLTPATGVATDEVKVTGSYFGSTCPKVTMEFKDAKGKIKKATCKVLKPYRYDDANGKPGKSVMDVETGASELIFVVPKGITATTPATLRLNCNGTIAQLSFNATE